MNKSLTNVIECWVPESFLSQHSFIIPMVFTALLTRYTAGISTSIQISMTLLAHNDLCVYAINRNKYQSGHAEGVINSKRERGKEAEGKKTVVNMRNWQSVGAAPLE